jgi:release factor glutamine methyltransferase
MSQNTIKSLISNTLIDKLDTKIILRHILNFSAANLIMEQDKILSENELNHFNLLLQKRLAGIPMAYIIGYKEFYSREFIVTPDTLIPRPETELLVDEVLKITNLQKNLKLLDMGTGSGCIAITCKLENKSLNVTALDKYEGALNIARKNATELHADINFLQSDWYSNVTNKYNLIVSNPPYIENNDPHLLALKHEPQHALTDYANGLVCFRTIISGATKHLLDGGYILLEHGYNQKNAITKILNDNNFHEIRTIKDYANLDRITIAKKTIEPPN